MNPLCLHIYISPPLTNTVQQYQSVSRQLKNKKYEVKNKYYTLLYLHSHTFVAVKTPLKRNNELIKQQPLINKHAKNV